MKIRVSGRARVRIRKQDEWWRSHRLDAPELFKQELAMAFERILRAPKVQKPYGEIDGVFETVWGARRGRGPKL